MILSMIHNFDKPINLRRMINLGRPKIFGLLSLFLTMIKKTSEDIWIVKQLRFTRAQVISLYFKYNFQVSTEICE